MGFCEEEKGGVGGRRGGGFALGWRAWEIDGLQHGWKYGSVCRGGGGVLAFCLKL